MVQLKNVKITLRDGSVGVVQVPADFLPDFLLIMKHNSDYQSDHSLDNSKSVDSYSLERSF